MILIVAVAPGATDAGKANRFAPQVELLIGFCEPREYAAAEVQVLVPVFFMVTETGYTWPVTIEEGTDCEMNCAALGGAEAAMEKATMPSVFATVHPAPSVPFLGVMSRE
ncbi:MAG TPA: hypothetical protein VF928_00010 [Usitatibacteraceae bacterium]